MISIEAAQTHERAPHHGQDAVGRLHRRDRWSTPSRRRADVYVVDIDREILALTQATESSTDQDPLEADSVLKLAS